MASHRADKCFGEWVLIFSRMNIEQLREYCLAKPHVTESFPFGKETLVFKVAGKIFAIISLETIEPQVTLKCDPEYAIELREQYEYVKPGYHANKKHWNTVYIENTIADSLIQSWIDHSYNEVVKRLPKKLKQR